MRSNLQRNHVRCQRPLLDFLRSFTSLQRLWTTAREYMVGSIENQEMSCVMTRTH